MARTASTTPGTAPVMIDLTRPDRRKLLGDAIAGLAGAVILAGGGAAMATTDAPAEPDAELVALCDRFCHLECAWCDVVNAAPATIAGEEEAEAFADEQFRAPQEDVAERIISLPASTLAGVKAKARCAVMFGACSYDAEQPYMGDRILSSLMTDLVGFPIDESLGAERIMRERFAAGDVA